METERPGEVMGDGEGVKVILDGIISYEDFIANDQTRLEKRIAGKKPLIIVLTGVRVDPDPLVCLDLGAAVLLEKRIGVIVCEGVKIPDGLFKLADAVESFANDDLASMQEAVAKIEKALEECSACGQLGGVAAHVCAGVRVDIGLEHLLGFEKVVDGEKIDQETL